MARERNWPKADEDREVAAVVAAGSVDPDGFTRTVRRAYSASLSGAPAGVVEAVLGKIDHDVAATAFVLQRNADVERENRETEAARRSRRGR